MEVRELLEGSEMVVGIHQDSCLESNNQEDCNDARGQTDHAVYYAMVRVPVIIQHLCITGLRVFDVAEEEYQTEEAERYGSYGQDQAEEEEEMLAIGGIWLALLLLSHQQENIHLYFEVRHNNASNMCRLHLHRCRGGGCSLNARPVCNELPQVSIQHAG